MRQFNGMVLHKKFSTPIQLFQTNKKPRLQANGSPAHDMACGDQSKVQILALSPFFQVLDAHKFTVASIDEHFANMKRFFAKCLGQFMWCCYKYD